MGYVGCYVEEGFEADLGGCRLCVQRVTMCVSGRDGVSLGSMYY